MSDNNTSGNNTSSTNQNHSQAKEALLQSHKNCISFVKKQLSDPVITFVLREIENMGCPLPNPFFRCERCLHSSLDKPKFSAAYVLGSFDKFDKDEQETDSDTIDTDNFFGKPGVLLCEDVMERYSKSDDKTVILHELIHAYDDCRAMINWKSCEQLACAEIRASSLSGECDFLHETRRGKLSGLRGQFMNCVKRRATLSLNSSAICGGQDNAKHVEDVFKTCFNDTEPFIKRI
ncbi:predicted protein [Naegleria gruberi]|uniref:Mitochondrial inner membrane protease ATP23 n=1 Tax=Naegleria gruberi TaxID=5762 RepID=D2VMV4_NAEGR|nr:uncharacterized protein NAEGRDRAFT_70273 [Naegleria gruberi]EFC41807.1 predicted protein [Naegleria gruberi]|eukprot:XP_002674551.1 predicted protein [Naegleria gruberi strain NEG-M]